MRSAKRGLLAVLIAATAACACFGFFACGEVRLSSIETECVGTEYVEGDAFDESSVTVTAVYSDGSRRTVTGWTVEGGDALAAGTASVVVAYTENGVTVRSEIAVTVSAKAHVHAFGETWECDGERHWRECACGERTDEAAHRWRAKTEVTKDAACAEGGEQILTCADCGYTKTEAIPALDHDYSISEYDDTGHWATCSRCGEKGETERHALKLSVENVRTSYFTGDTFTLDGAVASVSCGCGYVSSADVAEIRSSVTVLAAEDNGATVVLTLGDLTFDVTVTVQERELESIRLKEGVRTDYDLNEPLAAETLVLVYADGSKKEIPLTGEMVTGFDTSAYGAKRVTVTYEGKTTEFGIRVGYDAATGAYRLGTERETYKVQVEDDSYVDMSGAALQTGATSKFENEAKDSSGQMYPNGAEGYSTSNISVAGNKIVLRFYSDQAGIFRLGLRGQSGSSTGLQPQPLNEAFALTVNGGSAALSGTLGKACATDKAWLDMTLWTELEDIAGDLYMNVGRNEIELAFLGETAKTMRFPNLDYFTVTVVELFDDPALSVSGDAKVPVGGSYEGGLTLTVTNGGEPVCELPVTAGMIDGLDSSAAGSCEVTVTYLGLSVKHTVTVVSETHTLTVIGGTFANGGTTAELEYGEELPEITWAADDIVGWIFGTESLASVDGLTMGAENMTLRAVSAADADNIVLTNSVRYNSGMDDSGLGKAVSSVSDVTPAVADVSVYGENDARRYTFSSVPSNAKGVTYKANINFGSGGIAVFVSFTNGGSAALSGVAYGTECGIVSVGSVAAGETVTAAATIAADGAVHWTHVFWDGDVSGLDFTIAVYICVVA